MRPQTPKRTWGQRDKSPPGRFDPFLGGTSQRTQKGRERGPENTENNMETTIENTAAPSVDVSRLVRDLRDRLKQIVECEDAPDSDIGGNARIGLHCDVEDRSCSDRYEGADYGYAQGVKCALEWAVNEVQSILESLPNV